MTPFSRKLSSFFISYLFLATFLFVNNCLNCVYSSKPNYCDNFGTLASPKEARISLNAFVISNDDSRFNHTKNILSRIGFNVAQHNPIKYDSELLSNLFTTQYKRTKSFKDNESKNSSQDYSQLDKSNDKLRKTFSNKISFETVLKHFNNSDSFGQDEWIFLFEDDIRLYPNVTDPYCVIRAAMQIASHPISLTKSAFMNKKKNNSPVKVQHRVGDGIIYLGLCRHLTSICKPLMRTEQLPNLDNKVMIQRCFGSCAHAFGVVKWKVPFLLSKLESLHNEFSDYNDFHYFDVGMLTYGQRVHPILLVGSNLPSPQLGHSPHNHVGLFYQDRLKFPTTIG